MNGWGTVAVIALVLFVWWVWDVHRHPTKACVRCGGSGVHHSKLTRGAQGPCRVCKGKKGRRRLAAYVLRFDRDTHKRGRA